MELDDQSISGTYGDLEFKDGAASFQLRHGGSVTVKGLPGGTGFMVREGNNYAYTVTANGVSGSEYSGEIAAGDEVRVAFVNHRSGSSGGGGGDSGGGGTVRAESRRREALGQRCPRPCRIRRADPRIPRSTVCR